MATPAATMSGVVPSALGTVASAPASTSTRMASTSVTLAARKKGVAPSRFSRLRWPSFMPLTVMRASTSPPSAIILRSTSMLSTAPAGMGPGNPNPVFMRRVRTSWWRAFHPAPARLGSAPRSSM